MLQKKLKKTAKLLLQGDQDKGTLLKLAKKQQQYSNEMEDIMNYVESDALFDEAPMEPSELLGEPLETLLEQPGMEGSSQTLNMSISDLPYMPPRQQWNGSNSSNNLPAAGQGQSEGSGSGGGEYDDLHPISEEPSQHNNASIASLFASMASLNTTDHTLTSGTTANGGRGSGSGSSHDAATLRKKLKKVDRLLQQDDLDERQAKKLIIKRDQYLDELHQLSCEDADTFVSLDKSMGSVFGDKSMASFFGDKSLGSLAESSSGDDLDFDVSIGNHLQYLHEQESAAAAAASAATSARNGRGGGQEVEDDGHRDDRVPKTYDLRTLKKKMKKVKKLLASTDDPDELKAYRLKKQEYEQALERLRRQTKQHAESSSSSLMDDASTPLAPIPPRRQRKEQYNKHDDDDDDIGDGRDLELEKEHATLQKKIRKATILLDQAQEAGDTKLAKKLEAKRQEYLAKLNDMRKS